MTLGKQTLPVPSPFLVMATQNPIESEGTYPLPEAQLDRFMLKVVVDYPGDADELVVINRALAGPVRVEEALSLEQLALLQATVDSVYVDPALVRYAQQLAAATRDLDRVGLPDMAAYVEYGVAREDRSISPSLHALSQCCAAAATSSRRICSNSSRTSSGTGSCSAMKRSPTMRRPTTCSSV